MWSSGYLNGHRILKTAIRTFACSSGITAMNFKQPCHGRTHSPTHSAPLSKNRSRPYTLSNFYQMSYHRTTSSPIRAHRSRSVLQGQMNHFGLSQTDRARLIITLLAPFRASSKPSDRATAPLYLPTTLPHLALRFPDLVRPLIQTSSTLLYLVASHSHPKTRRRPGDQLGERHQSLPRLMVEARRLSLRDTPSGRTQ